jgi:uncharacterized protein (DUF2147 family)
MNPRPLGGLLAAALLLAAMSASAAAVQAPIDGLWLNPKGSVAVRTGPCGAKLCGWVAWANAKATKDAQESGIDRLIGTALLENYTVSGSNVWQGTVFVPDMGHRFSSTIAWVDPDTLRIKGCLIGGFFCRSQIWHRIERLPAA